MVTTTFLRCLLLSLEFLLSVLVALGNTMAQFDIAAYKHKNVAKHKMYLLTIGNQPKYHSAYLLLLVSRTLLLSR